MPAYVYSESVIKFNNNNTNIRRGLAFHWRRVEILRVVYLYFSDVYEFYEFRLRCGVYSVGGMSSMICSLLVFNYRTYRIPKSP